jgi:hypothetical protein
MNINPETTSPELARLLERFAQVDAFLGFGYIGGRRHLSEANQHGADRMLLQRASVLEMTETELFDWANSKDGRWYADCWADGNQHGHAAKYLPSIETGQTTCSHPEVEHPGFPCQHPRFNPYA